MSEKPELDAKLAEIEKSLKKRQMLTLTLVVNEDKHEIKDVNQLLLTALYINGRVK